MLHDTRRQLGAAVSDLQIKRQKDSWSYGQRKLSIFLVRGGSVPYLVAYFAMRPPEGYTEEQVISDLVRLADFAGRNVVLYFYPKADTPGCTTQACGIRDHRPDYDAANAVVLGVSLDTVESHKTFCTKDSLTFKLLADPDHKVIDAYGVPLMAHGDMKFAQRDTFLISPDGKIVKVWTSVNPNTHSDDVLAEIQAQKKM